MTESILSLTLAGILLVLVPQLVSWLAVSFAFRRGRWWPILLSVPLAALCFAALAKGLYSPDQASALQVDDHSSGRILVEQVTPGALAHAGLALILQVARLVSGK